MKSFGIVSTQMQLLNCVELLQTLGIDHNELLVMAFSAERKRQILHIIESLSYTAFFKKISVVEPKYKSDVFNSFYFKRKINKATFRCSTYDTLLIFNYKNIYIRYAYYKIWEKVPNINTYVVDDGMSNLEILRRRNEELNAGKASIELGRRHYSVVFPLNGLKKCVAPKLSFFTNHDSINIHLPDVFIRNNYEHVRNGDFSKLTFDEDMDICFIGQPLPQFGTLDKETYNLWIRKFITDYNVRKGSVKYIPHPAEIIDENIEEELKKELTITNLDLPIEIYALKFSSSVIVAGFYSAALFNVHKIRPDLKVYCINPFNHICLAPAKKQTIDAVFSVLINSGVEVYKNIFDD